MCPVICSGHGVLKAGDQADEVGALCVTLVVMTCAGPRREDCRRVMSGTFHYWRDQISRRS